MKTPEVTKKQVTGWIERCSFRDLKFEKFFQTTRSPKQGVCRMPDVWSKLDNIYVNKEDYIKIKITIERMED